MVHLGGAKFTSSDLVQNCFCKKSYTPSKPPNLSSHISNFFLYLLITVISQISTSVSSQQTIRTNPLWRSTDQTALPVLLATLIRQSLVFLGLFGIIRLIRSDYLILIKSSRE
ncbi:hypothetical protein PPACK8108_LOCUS6093, partial [Phakopsora pachyrhizi]